VLLHLLEHPDEREGGADDRPTDREEGPSAEPSIQQPAGAGEEDDAEGEGVPEGIIPPCLAQLPADPLFGRHNRGGKYPLVKFFASKIACVTGAEDGGIYGAV